GLDDGALHAIAEIVHDIDLKDDRFGRAETAGVALVLAGIASATTDDEARLARGAELFDGLYATMSAGGPEKRRGAGRGRATVAQSGRRRRRRRPARSSPRSRSRARRSWATARRPRPRWARPRGRTPRRRRDR